MSTASRALTRTLMMPMPHGAASARFHRFAPRTLAYMDPRSASPLPPFARARRFLEHVDTLTPSAWGALDECVATQSDAHEEAQRHLFSMFVTPARMAARDAIALEAGRVCLRAVDGGRLANGRGTYLVHRVTSAALALILRDLLPPELFDLVYHPFTLVRDGELPLAMPEADGGGSTMSAVTVYSPCPDSRRTGVLHLYSD